MAVLAAIEWDTVLMTVALVAVVFLLATRGRS
jgi:hypothetical protein